LVYAKIPIPDPQGHNPKQGRPFVVISRNEDINQGGVIHAVGITSELQSAPAECYLLLPYGPNAKTGLKQKSAALCTWLIEIAPERLEISRGYIHPDLVDQIVKKVLELNSNPQAVEGEQDDEGP
jgi:mRNA-degrading endonuclease toxin of MazEF toxin-antitoxin module